MTGTYTDIVEIIAPASADAGSTVNVEVRIKNKWTDSVHIYCVAALHITPHPGNFIDWLDAWVAPGETRSFYGSFIMPNRNVTIIVHSLCAPDLTYADDHKEKDVSLPAAVRYIDIVEIVAPASAAAGDLVQVAVRVRNLCGYAIYIAVTGAYDETVFPLAPDYAAVDAGAIGNFAGSFIMPAKKTTVMVWGYFWTGTDWVFNDGGSVDIALAAAQVPQISSFTIVNYAKV